MRDGMMGTRVRDSEVLLAKSLGVAQSVWRVESERTDGSETESQESQPFGSETRKRHARKNPLYKSSRDLRSLRRRRTPFRQTCQPVGSASGGKLCSFCSLGGTTQVVLI